MNDYKYFTNKPDRKCYQLGNTVIKEFTKPIRQMDEEWYLHYQEFNNRYRIMPDIIDFEPGYKIVMDYIPGKVLEENNSPGDGTVVRPRRENLVDILKMYTHFAEYSAEIKKDFYHWDIHDNNLIMTNDGKLMLVDPDSISINIPQKTALAFHMLNDYVLRLLDFNPNPNQRWRKLYEEQLERFTNESMEKHS